MEDLQRKVMDAMARAVPLDAASIKPNSTFDELGIDSLDVVNIVFELESALEIKIPEDFRLSALGNVTQVTAAMENLLVVNGNGRG